MPEKRGLRGENAELCRRALRSVQLVPTLTRVKFSILGKAPESNPQNICGVPTSRETSPAGHSVASSGGCCLSREAKFTLDYKSALDLPLEKLKSKPEMYETDPESFKCIPE